MASREENQLAISLQELTLRPKHSPLSTRHCHRREYESFSSMTHAMVRQGLRSVLDSYPDIEVVGEAWNGEVAVKAVDSLHPSIVLMDINMPKMKGMRHDCDQDQSS